METEVESVKAKIFDGAMRRSRACCILVAMLAMVLFSTFSTPALSALFTFFLWVIGHFSGDLLRLGEISKTSLVRWICSGVYYVVPNLSNFEILGSRHIIRGPLFKPADPVLFGGAFLYCVLYCAVILSLAVTVFLRRDFK